MQPRRPIEIKLIAVVAGYFVLFPILLHIYFMGMFCDAGMSFRKCLNLFLKFFYLDLKYGDMTIMALWAGLLVTIWKQSRWALAFSTVLALLALLILLASWATLGGLAPMTELNGFALVIIANSVAPFFVFEAVFKLWRRGKLR